MARVVTLIAALVLSLSSVTVYAYDGNVPGEHPQEKIWGAPLAISLIAGVVIALIAAFALIVRYEHNRYDAKMRSVRKRRL